MRIEYDRNTCIGMFQCVDEWAGFEQDLDAGKATLVDGEERTEDGRGTGVFVGTVPEGQEHDAEMAARVCPVDAITLVSDDDEPVVP